MGRTREGMRVLTTAVTRACLLCLAGALFATGCSPSPGNTDTSPHPTQTADATDASTASPSPTASVPANEPAEVPEQFRARDHTMTDEDAFDRARNPGTGEFWLTRPLPTPRPLWADVDPEWGSESAMWW